MKNMYNGIKKNYKIKKRKLEGYSNRHKKSALGDSLFLGIKLAGVLLPLGLGAFVTTAGIKGITEKAIEKEMSSDFKISKTEIYDKEEIKDKKSAVYEYSPFVQMPDGSYMRTIKTYDPANLSANEVAKTLKRNPDADIKEFFGEPIEITSEVRENLLEVDNINRHYSAKIYKSMSEDAALIILGVSLADLLLGLLTIVAYDVADPVDTLDDLKSDIRSIRDDSKDIKKERKIYQEQKKEIKVLTKSLKI